MGTRHFIFLSYKGSAYHGWQVQPNSITIQQIVEESLSTILNEEIRITGAGRTDSGVHAKFFCAHFNSRNDSLHENPNLVHRLNRFLPVDISIQRIISVPSGAHARFSALSRSYEYHIALKKSVFNTDFSWFLPKELNTELMNKACSVLKNNTDFTSFSKSGTDVKTNNCVIYEAIWNKKDNDLIFTIRADRFLRNMVRAIVGTMVDIGLGKTTIDGFEKIIESKNRCNAGQSVPAKGLFLVDIEYDNSIVPVE